MSLDPPLTPAQLLYLEAFDSFLRADTDADRLKARQSMSIRLNFMLAEANLELPNNTRWEDSINDWMRDPLRNPRSESARVRVKHARRVRGRFARVA